MRAALSARKMSRAREESATRSMRAPEAPIERRVRDETAAMARPAGGHAQMLLRSASEVQSAA